ncbi:unnamed protein product [Mesocestoides corti]|uniref:GOLD domain-containing protein n=1 Tax=Mesocestoides corti TaxID=53468 RepID=A0A0R3U9X8_MESCO|nr:unnamed protein product [Mesocestoides corti]
MRVSFSAICMYLFSFVTILVDAFPKQLTFELSGTEPFCFYEKLEKNEEYTFMFQVLKGASSDIDVVVSDINKNVVAKQSESSHETLFFSARTDGDYSFCFNNHFSPMSPKRVFFELRSKESLREEAGLQDSGPSTMIETLAETIHEHLSVSEGYQTELRAKLTADRLFAHELLHHITVWSTAVAIIIVVTVVAQISILKSFFKNKQHLYSSYNSNF